MLWDDKRSPDRWHFRTQLNLKAGTCSTIVFDPPLLSSFDLRLVLDYRL